MLSLARLTMNRQSVSYRIFCGKFLGFQSTIPNQYGSTKSIKLLSSYSSYIRFHRQKRFSPILYFSNEFSSISESKNTDYLSGTLSSRLVDRLPEKIRPFARLMRLDKPTGTWLLLLPCWWSIGLSTTAGSLPSLSLMGLFGIGAVMMRSAGCIVNDIWDRRFDRNVERTRLRPLASQQIDLTEAVALLFTLLGSSLLVLIQFDLNSILLGASSLLLVASYPSFKRFTYWPQLILGMTFNWGTLLGWSVNTGGMMNISTVLPLYMAGICWTLIYDTIYAHQDKMDDLVLGLKSTALKFGSKTPRYLNGFTAMMTVSLLSSGIITNQTWPFYLSVGILTAGLIRINRQLDVDSIQSCARAFRQNTQIGWILLFGIVTGTLLKPSINCKDVNLSQF